MGNKDDQLIMVIKEDDLFRNGRSKENAILNDILYFEGFAPGGLFNFSKIIQQKFGFITRKFAEQDSNYKQPIPYGFVINPISKKILVYQRSSESNKYNEKRLQGKLSIGVGGHIELDDYERFGVHFITDSMRRELEEEIETIEGGPIRVVDMSKVGYIYLNYGVHAVHLGIVYAIQTSEENFRAKDHEGKNVRLVDFDELESLCKDPKVEVEDWSKTLIPHLKDYLEKIPVGGTPF